MRCYPPLKLGNDTNFLPKYDDVGQREDAHLAYSKCLELNPDLPDVRARLEELDYYHLQNVLEDHKVHQMRQCELRLLGEIRAVERGTDIIINLIKSLNTQNTQDGETDDSLDSSSDLSSDISSEAWEDISDNAED